MGGYNFPAWGAPPPSPLDPQPAAACRPPRKVSPYVGKSAIQVGPAQYRTVWPAKVRCDPSIPVRSDSRPLAPRCGPPRVQGGPLGQLRAGPAQVPADELVDDLARTSSSRSVRRRRPCRRPAPPRPRTVGQHRSRHSQREHAIAGGNILTDLSNYAGRMIQGWPSLGNCSAVPAPIVTAAAAFDPVVSTNNGIDRRLPFMPAARDPQVRTPSAAAVPRISSLARRPRGPPRMRSLRLRWRARG
jgi:hypothetical protein